MLSCFAVNTHRRIRYREAMARRSTSGCSYTNQSSSSSPCSAAGAAGSCFSSLPSRAAAGILYIVAVCDGCVAAANVPTSRHNLALMDAPPAPSFFPCFGASSDLLICLTCSLVAHAGRPVQRAPIHHHRLPTDPPPPLPHQPHHLHRHIPPLPHHTQRYLLHLLAAHLVQAQLHHARRAGDGAGRNAVDADAELAPLEGERAGQRVHSGLGCSGVRLEGGGVQVESGADVDDGCRRTAAQLRSEGEARYGQEQDEEGARRSGE